MKKIIITILIFILLVLAGFLILKYLKTPKNPYMPASQPIEASDSENGNIET